jgi:hypothetical protein
MEGNFVAWDHALGIRPPDYEQVIQGLDIALQDRSYVYTPQAMNVTSAETYLRRMAPVCPCDLQMVRVLRACFSFVTFCEILCIATLKMQRFGVSAGAERI